MFSIDNTYLEELRRYSTRTAKLLAGEAIAWVVELKVDGVAVSLTYENRALDHGATRGDGYVGDDITHDLHACRRRATAASRHGCAAERGDSRRDLHDQHRPGRHQCPPPGGRQGCSSPTRRTRLPAASSCSIRVSVPSGGCDSFATASATSMVCPPIRTSTSSSWCGPAGACPSTPLAQRFESFDEAVDHCQIADCAAARV